MSQNISPREEGIQLAQSYYNLLSTRRMSGNEWDTYVKAFMNSVHKANCYTSDGNLTLEGVRTAVLNRFPTLVDCLYISNGCLCISTHPVQENVFVPCSKIQLASVLPCFYLTNFPQQFNIGCNTDAETFKKCKGIIDSRFTGLRSEYNGSYVRRFDSINVDELHDISGQNGFSMRWSVLLEISLVHFMQHKTRYGYHPDDVKILLKWLEYNVFNPSIIRGTKVWYGSFNVYALGTVDTDTYGIIDSPVLLSGYCSKVQPTSKNTYVQFAVDKGTLTRLLAPLASMRSYR